MRSSAVMSLRHGMNMPRFENRSTMVTMASCPCVVGGNPETQWTDPGAWRVCDVSFVSGAGPWRGRGGVTELEHGGKLEGGRVVLTLFHPMQHPNPFPGPSLLGCASPCEAQRFCTSNGVIHCRALSALRHSGCVCVCVCVCVRARGGAHVLLICKRLPSVDHHSYTCASNP